MKRIQSIVLVLAACILCAGGGYWAGSSGVLDFSNQEYSPEVMDGTLLSTGGALARGLHILSMLDDGEIDRARRRLVYRLSLDINCIHGLLEEYPESPNRRTVLPVCERASQYLRDKEGIEMESQQENGP